MKQFEAFLSPLIGGKKIISFTVNNLLAPGENYGSTMLAVDVKLERNEYLHLIAKMCPSSELMMNIFNIPVTFKKEVYFYSTIVSILQEFQRKRGSEKMIDFFPKYYGSRLSLNPESQEVDQDACILLENIKFKGYATADRIEGYNLETAELIIKDMAMFHAVPIAFKLTHPKRFIDEIVARIPRSGEEDSSSHYMAEMFIQQILNSAKQNKECAEYLDQIKDLMIKQNEYELDKNARDNEPFATLSHGDLWTNNVMLKFNDNGKPVKNVLVDFQFLIYGNFAHDLIFFIYTSLSTDIITQHYQRLIDLHYNTFVDILKDLKINTKQFTYKLFLKEIENAAKNFQFYHIMAMLKVIFTDKSKVKDLSDVKFEDFLDMTTVHEKYYTKLWHTILDFADKGWLSTKKN